MHYHEVYFNKYTNDGPRVGRTRRFAEDIRRERVADYRAGRLVYPGAVPIRCDRPDEDCPWTVEGVPTGPKL